MNGHKVNGDDLKVNGNGVMNGHKVNGDDLKVNGNGECHKVNGHSNVNG
jgi:hypothetical protein